MFCSPEQKQIILPQCFDFLLPSTCGNTQHFADTHRKFKGHYQDSIPCYMAERTATHARARQRQTLGKFSHSALWNEKSVQVDLHLEVMVAIGGFHPSHPKNESPSINILPTHADHNACWRTTSTADWTTKMPPLRWKKKWSSAGEQHRHQCSCTSGSSANRSR